MRHHAESLCVTTQRPVRVAIEREIVCHQQRQEIMEGVESHAGDETAGLVVQPRKKDRENKERQDLRPDLMYG